MATATKKSRVPRQAARRAAPASESPAIKFLVFEDNGGDFHWTVLGGSGESLAQSVPFATYDDAHRAALVVRDGAGSAGFETLAASNRPADLVARRAAAIARDDSDPERWLDEGHHVGTGAATR